MALEDKICHSAAPKAIKHFSDIEAATLDKRQSAGEILFFEHLQSTRPSPSMYRMVKECQNNDFDYVT